jgi:Fe-S cluster assembly protein SufD
MTVATQSKDITRTELATLAEVAVETGPQWLRERRQGALARFRELGLPTRKHEEWRFTNLRAVEQTPFIAAPDARGQVNAEALDQFLFPGLNGPRLVFINGRYAPILSDELDLPRGVRVMTLAEAFERDDETIRPHLTKYADFEDEAFTALNTAAMEDGTVMVVDRNVQFDRPVHVLNVTVAGDDPVVTHPRNLIVVDESAEATLIEDYVHLGDVSVYLTNAVTEIVVGANAQVSHYFIERESERAFNVATLRVEQQRDSRFNSHSVLLGGAIVRNNVNPVLDGEGCDSLLNGLYIGRNTQHMDNHMRVVHGKANCDSRQYYRGIMDDESHGVFSGRIVVVRDAQKTDAIQSNQNLLLSPKAQVNTKPQLEIFADDVTCTHGATVGELDENAVFYLRSRGMSENAAMGMLIYSAARESLERMKVEAVREHLTGILLDRLPHTQALKPYLL